MACLADQFYSITVLSGYHVHLKLNINGHYPLVKRRDHTKAIILFSSVCLAGFNTKNEIKRA